MLMHIKIYFKNILKFSHHPIFQFSIVIFSTHNLKPETFLPSITLAYDTAGREL